LFTFFVFWVEFQCYRGGGGGGATALKFHPKHEKRDQT
jgi:hypothetical protein